MTTKITSVPHRPGLGPVPFTSRQYLIQLGLVFSLSVRAEFIPCLWVQAVFFFGENQNIPQRIQELSQSRRKAGSMYQMRGPLRPIPHRRSSDAKARVRRVGGDKRDGGQRLDP